MVLEGRNVVRSFDLLTGKLAKRTFIEWTPPSGKHAGVVDQVLDHRLRLRPVHLSRSDKMHVLLARWREPAVTCHGRGGADKDDGQDTLREVECDQLREPSTR